MHGSNFLHKITTHSKCTYLITKLKGAIPGIASCDRFDHCAGAKVGEYDNIHIGEYDNIELALVTFHATYKDPISDCGSKVRRFFLSTNPIVIQ